MEGSCLEGVDQATARPLEEVLDAEPHGPDGPSQGVGALHVGLFPNTQRNVFEFGAAKARACLIWNT